MNISDRFYNEKSLGYGVGAVARFEYQVGSCPRVPNTPKYKPRNIGKKSNQSSPTKRALPNVLNFTD